MSRWENLTLIKSAKISAYIYSIASISLVLFMVGVLGMIMMHTKSLSDHFRENIEITLILQEKTTTEQAQAIQTWLLAQSFTKDAVFVSKEAAAQGFVEYTDEDFLEVLGYNPLFASISLYLESDYAAPEKIKNLQENLLAKENIAEVYYHQGLMEVIHANIKKIGWIMLGLSVLFLFITITLIDNTIRMSMYSNRFLIKSMQLVGATRRFISQPFLFQSVYNGIISGLLAAIAMILVLFLAHQQLPELKLIFQAPHFVFLCLSIIFTGVLISLVSTTGAVSRYLRQNLDELY